MKGTFERLSGMVIAFVVMVTAVVVVLLAQVTLDIRSELRGFKAALTAHERESTRRTSVEPFSPLESNCVSCHTGRRFLGAHGPSSQDLSQIVKKMATMPDAPISAQERERIHASLMLLKCVRCHDETNLRKLAPLEDAERIALIRRMKEKPKSEIASDEVREILRAYRRIQGF